MTGAWLDLPPDTGFGIANLPYGVFSTGSAAPRCGVRIGDSVLDLAAVLDDPVFSAPVLNPFMAQGPARWRAARERITALLTGASPRPAVLAALHPLPSVRLHLPFEAGDYVDFFACEEHARNAGQIFRPGAVPLTPNWKHLPVGYHGRSGTIVLSGTPVVRPSGQYLPPGSAAPVFGPSTRMDFEAEVGFVIGTGSALGSPVAAGAFSSHVFGVFLVNDWSSRDLQSWESAPLGPHLGKSFATSISPWVVPLDALSHAWVSPPVQDPRPLPYLASGESSGLDLALEIRLNGELISAPPFAGMYWTPAQMLAHMTVNGASTRTGDCYASGTVSGAGRDQLGCLLELSWGGTRAVELGDGTSRYYLEDGDEVTISATAPGAGGTGPQGAGGARLSLGAGGARLSLGEVTGRITPARAS